MTEGVGPEAARHAVDRLEDAIVDPERARDDAEAADDSGDASDKAERVPGSPEPPD